MNSAQLTLALDTPSAALFKVRSNPWFDDWDPTPGAYAPHPVRETRLDICVEHGIVMDSILTPTICGMNTHYSCPLCRTSNIALCVKTHSKQKGES
jgi:hypothetical protein